MKNTWIEAELITTDICKTNSDYCLDAASLGSSGNFVKDTCCPCGNPKHHWNGNGYGHTISNGKGHTNK